VSDNILGEFRRYDLINLSYNPAVNFMPLISLNEISFFDEKPIKAE
jgi:hypothetical protein